MKRHGWVLIAAFVAACASAPPAKIAQEPEVKRNCVRETGTRIEKPDDGMCQPGRVYTREDLERSGGIGTGDALKRITR
jgi:outer membrane cobalamin receptor